MREWYIPGNLYNSLAFSYGGAGGIEGREVSGDKRNIEENSEDFIVKIMAVAFRKFEMKFTISENVEPLNYEIFYLNF